MANSSDRQTAPASNVVEFSVTEISNLLKRTVEDAFGLVRVRGEISGFRGPHSSGHCYFALKDDRARLEAVIWRGVLSRLKYYPEEGMEVIATGKLTTYPGTSKYQIVIDNLEPAGAGALMALLEQRKKKLAAEGLFEESRKRPLPFMPTVIGVVTSPTGAVIRDVLHRLSDRFPLHVIVWPVRVQGDTCGPEVAAAIEGFNRLDPAGPVKRPDLIIVARGGGSIEDLWGFNDEAVVRAAAASTIPLVSAIGHETDWTLIDLAADRRAPTPTGAAEIAVPVKAELEAFAATLAARLAASVRRNLERMQTELRSAARGLGSPDAILSTPRQRIDVATGRLATAMRLAVRRKETDFGRVAGRLGPALIRSRVGVSRDRLRYLSGRARTAFRNRLDGSRARIDNVQRQLHWRKLQRAIDNCRNRLEQNWRLIGSLSHEKVLERGFALIRDAAGTPVSRAAAIKTGDRFGVQMHDGTIAALATDGERPGSGDTSEKRSRRGNPAKSSPRRSGGDQGSLF